LSFLCYSLSLPENQHYQERVRESIFITQSFDEPLPASTIASILEDVWINAIVKETLLIYPAVPVELPRVVPAGGTTIDGIWLPEGTLTSGFIESVNYSLIDKTGSNIQWTPERWLMKEGANGADKLHEEARIQELERRMWGFGSGARGMLVSGTE